MGKIKDADGIGKVGNITCGDVMWLYIKVKKDKRGEEKISNIRFETFGCIAAIATSSAITDMAKRKSLPEALKISKGMITSSLGGLPPIKVHCSVLASDALAEAIYDYYSKNKKSIPKDLQERHEGLQETLKHAEERHIDYMKFEEKVLGVK